jgi:hypothetical protein
MPDSIITVIRPCSMAAGAVHGDAQQAERSESPLSSQGLTYGFVQVGFALLSTASMQTVPQHMH